MFDDGFPRKLSVKLGDVLKDRVPHLAEARQRSAHWIVRAAIGRYVEREDKRVACHQDAILA
ncbi:ribbon-helix-helix domain-containing protein [Erwinia amylovora]|uniref:CopG family ribbon-helix-helix protein n=1 Tax=Erwinia amylovora TaxID=552 RepID=UPI0030DA4772